MKIDLLNDGCIEYTKKLDFSSTWSVAHYFRFQFFNFIINSNNYENILDVGCGQGSLTNLLMKNDNKFNYLGLDLNQNYINVLKQKYSDDRCNFGLKDIYDNSLDDKLFDCIVLGEVIEHVNKNEQHKFLKRVCDLMTNNGIILLSTPNKLNNNVNWPIDHEDEYSYDELNTLFHNYFNILFTAGLWRNTKETYDNINNKDISNIKFQQSLFNVLNNFQNPEKSKHLLYILSKKV